MDVFLTVDVELWPANWSLDPKAFPSYFDRYILGKTRSGYWGLPFQLEQLNLHGLKGIFFIEPLFALEFGLGPLSDTVTMIQEAGHEVQLHLHTEWVGKGEATVLPGRQGANLRDFTAEEQTALLGKGLEHLAAAGASNVFAFRAGNFGANRDTLCALARHGIIVDSSYNQACKLGPFLNIELWQPAELEGIWELPVAVFRDGSGKLRHAQIGSAGLTEMTVAMERGYQSGWRSFVVFWHSAEFLDGSRRRQDPLVARRFNRLCEFLAYNRERFSCRFLSEFRYGPLPSGGVTEPPWVNRMDTFVRQGEQAVSRLFAI